MATKPTHTFKSTTTITKGNRTTTRTVTKSGGNTTVTKTITIGKPKKVAAGKKTAGKSKGKTSKPVKLARVSLGSSWPSEMNDTLTLCGATAVADALLAATGMRASNGDVERLYRAAGGHGDSGTRVEALLAAASVTGLAGCRLAGWHLAEDEDARLLVMSLAGTPDLHAAAVLPDGRVATWGETVPLDDLQARTIEAWSLTWHGEEGR